MRVGPLRPLLVTATIAACALAGCGTNPTAARTAFRAQANAICKQGNAAVGVITNAMRKAQRGGNPDKVFRRLSSLTREGAATFLPYVNRLDALSPPAADGDAIKAWIEAQRRQLTLEDSLSAAYKAQDTARIATLSEQIDTLAQASNSFARSYGMQECAKPG